MAVLCSAGVEFGAEGWQAASMGLLGKFVFAGQAGQMGPSLHAP